LETTDWTGVDGFVECAVLHTPGGKAIGIFDWVGGDMMGARIGGNDLSTAYTSTTTACREMTILREWLGNQELGKFAGTISNSNLQAGN
jgi:hypothetical protein